MDNLSNRWQTLKKYTVAACWPASTNVSVLKAGLVTRPPCTSAPPVHPHPGSQCLIIHAVGGGGTEILFGAYLDIYCSTECSITMYHRRINISDATDKSVLRLPINIYISGHLELVFLVSGVCFHTFTLQSCWCYHMKSIHYCKRESDQPQDGLCLDNLWRTSLDL